MRVTLIVLLLVSQQFFDETVPCQEIDSWCFLPEGQQFIDDAPEPEFPSDELYDVEYPNYQDEVCA